MEAAADEAARVAALQEAHQRLEASERALAAAIATSGDEACTHDAAGRRRVVAYGRRSARPVSKSVASTVPSADTDVVLSYPRSTTAACVLRADGSCVLRWPGGGLAATVEPEPLSPLGFRLSASHRASRRMAATFDGHGNGFAYHEDGSLLLSHEATRGGSVHDARGQPVCVWDETGCVSSGAAASAGSAADDGGGATSCVAPVRSGGRLCLALGDCMALLFGLPAGAGSRPAVSLAFRCDGFQQLLILGMNPQRATWEAALDAMPAISSLHASSRPRPRRNFKDAREAAGTALPAALAQVGGPRPSLGGGIADALALLPDLKSLKETAATSGALSRRR